MESKIETKLTRFNLLEKGALFIYWINGIQSVPMRKLDYRSATAIYAFGLTIGTYINPNEEVEELNY